MKVTFELSNDTSKIILIPESSRESGLLREAFSLGNGSKVWSEGTIKDNEQARVIIIKEGQHKNHNNINDPDIDRQHVMRASENQDILKKGLGDTYHD